MKHKNALLTALVLLLSVTLSRAQNTQTFSFQGFVFQTYTIPVSGYYLLTSKGGEGGSCDSRTGGKGASMSCYYFLNEGEQLRIAVAGAGQSVVNNTNQYPNGAGGGGSSSIVLANGNSYLPVLIAGGGGGAGNGRDGDAAQVTQNGTPGKYDDGSSAGSAGVAGGGGGTAYVDGKGGGGAGYYTDGGTNGIINTNNINAWGGQAYLSGNYGGGGHLGGDGGWGGGGEGGEGYKELGGANQSYDGGGGGGGGYSGGGAGYTRNSIANDVNGGSGGGGGSFISPIANTNGLVQLPGNNSGNGVVTITGPNTQTDVVNTPFNPYTWPANGMSYSAAGTYTFRDSVNSVIRILDLSFGLQSCTSYTRIDTTIVSCGSYTSPLNGRTYTQNTTDSIRVGCVKYVARIVVAQPVALLGWLPIIATNTTSTGTLAVCKKTSHIIIIPPVPYATSYQWTLPSGATGASTNNSITVQFGNNFRGGNICVKPVNACGAGASICRPITVLNTPPTGSLQITKPAAPHISGSYSVAPMPGATYTWSVSNNTAIIVSGQGTSQIHLEVLPGFTRANLTVRASNCKGNGSQRTLVIQGQQNSCGNTGKTTDLSRMMAEIPVSIYPNPSSGRFTLNTPSLKSYAMLEVYSEDGRLVYRKQIPAHTTQSNITLPKQTSAGIYNLRLLTEDGVKTMRLVKE